jgi:hypothetical protein
MCFSRPFISTVYDYFEDSWFLCCWLASQTIEVGGAVVVV